jgi:hypothetical protein
MKKMNKIAIILLLLLFYFPGAGANSEKFIYEIRFGFIKGGEAFYQTTETHEDNSNVIHAKLQGKTTGFANILYAVDDCFESYINKENLLPNKSFKILKEQKFRFSEEVTFNQEEEVAFSKNSGWHDVKSGICDVSSIMYNLRFSGKLDHLKLNQVIEVPFWDTDEWYILKLKYTGTEKLNTSLGKKECLRLEPQKIAGRFFNKKNPMNIWVTNDLNKYPVLMELNFTIGSVKCELKKIKHP